MADPRDHLVRSELAFARPFERKFTFWIFTIGVACRLCRDRSTHLGENEQSVVTRRPTTMTSWTAPRGLVLSALLFSLIAATKFTSPNRSLGGWGTDHVSHWASAFLFSQIGFEIYRVSANSICPQTLESDAQLMIARGIDPRVTCVLPSTESHGPSMINWPQYARVYPPGAFLYALPEAFLFYNGWLTYEQTNLVSIIKYGVMAHLVFALLLICWFGDLRAISIDSFRQQKWTWVVMAVLFSDLINHSLSGFYDPIYLLFIALSVLCLQRKQGALSVLFYAFALLFHFRALWWAPLCLFALPLVWRELQNRDQRLKALAALTLTGGVFFVALKSLVLVRPWLFLFPINNSVHFSFFGSLEGIRGIIFLCLSAATALYFLRFRAWYLAIALGWQTYMMLFTQEVRPWHRLSLLPFFLLLTLQPQEMRRRLLPGVVAICLIETLLIFRGPCPFFWGLLGLF